MDAADFLLALYPAPLASVAQREALAALVAYTQRVMQDFNDPCHDFQHVCRVVKLALQIASEECRSIVFSLYLFFLFFYFFFFAKKIKSCRRGAK